MDMVALANEIEKVIQKHRDQSVRETYKGERNYG